MPFVRFARDKRGYEHIYLVHAPIKRGRPAKPRVLYWYRSPPGVKVGREAFDAATRKALEAQYPDLTFDWDTLAAPPPPVAAVEPWRERRRLRKLQRVRPTDADAPESDAETDGDSGEGGSPDVEALEVEALETDTELLPDRPRGDSVQESQERLENASDVESADSAESPDTDVPAAAADAPPGADPQAASSPRRSRRRRGRRRSNRPGSGQESTAQPSNGGPDAVAGGEAATGGENGAAESFPGDNGEE